MVRVRGQSAYRPHLGPAQIRRAKQPLEAVAQRWPGEQFELEHLAALVRYNNDLNERWGNETRDTQLRHY
jgi:hypothetical protein